MIREITPDPESDNKRETENEIKSNDGQNPDMKVSTDVVPYNGNNRSEDVNTRRSRRSTRPSPSWKPRNRIPPHKDIIITGSDYVHFGNTYVSYGFVNTTNRGQRRDSDDLLRYLSLDDDDPRFSRRNRPTISIRPHSNIHIMSAKLREQKKREEEEKMKKRLLLTYGILGLVVVVLIIAVIITRVYKSVSGEEEKKNHPSQSKTPDFGPDLMDTPRSFGLSNDCNDINKTLNARSRIRFVVRKSLLFYCPYGRPDCRYDYTELETEYDYHRKNNFKDIYYNYVIESNEKILKGRYLSKCSFDELSSDHSDIIIVGIGYCFYDKDASENKYSNELKSIERLIGYLQNQTLLTENYELQFLKACGPSNLVSKVKEKYKTVTYYDIDTYKNDAKNNSVTNFKNIDNIIYLPEKLFDTTCPYTWSGKNRIKFMNYNKKIDFDCKEDCNHFIKDAERNKGSYNYYIFLNGSYCRSNNMVTGGSNNIALVSDCPNHNNKLENLKTFAISMFKLSTEIKNCYKTNQIGSDICHDQSTDFDQFESILSVIFNGNKDVKQERGFDRPFRGGGGRPFGSPYGAQFLIQQSSRSINKRDLPRAEPYYIGSHYTESNCFNSYTLK